MPQISDKQLDLIIEKLLDLQDEGPDDYGWKSEALLNVIKELEGIQQSESAIGVALSKAAPVQ